MVSWNHKKTKKCTQNASASSGSHTFLKQLLLLHFSICEKYLPSPLYQASYRTPCWGVGAHFQSHLHTQAGTFLGCCHMAFL